MPGSLAGPSSTSEKAVAPLAGKALVMVQPGVSTTRLPPTNVRSPSSSLIVSLMTTSAARWRFTFCTLSVNVTISPEWGPALSTSLVMSRSAFSMRVVHASKKARSPSASLLAVASTVFSTKSPELTPVSVPLMLTKPSPSGPRSPNSHV